MPTDKNYEEIHGGLHPVKAWVKGVDFAENAKQQLRNIATLPFIHKWVAAMPDVHLGKGATVGSVIPTVGAIVPAAVGVDLGCLDKDTEYLTPSGWRKFDSYVGGQVLQYDPLMNIAKFVYPLAYVRRPVTDMYHLKHSKGLDQMVCDRHKILFYKGYGREVGSREYSIYVSEDFVNHHKTLKKGFAGGFQTVFNVSVANPVNLTLEQLRVQIMVSADGCIRSQGYCELHLRKDRKIDRARTLLDLANIDFKLYDHADGTVTFKFDPPRGDKSLSFVYGCSQVQLETIRDEVFRWDGHTAEDGQEVFSTSIREHADAIQYALAACGIRAGIFTTDYPDKSWENSYQVYTTKNPYVNMAADSTNPVEKVPSLDGFSYCFMVPSGFLVARRNNNIFVTGNCGMSAVRTSLTASDLPDDLKSIRESIEKHVPHGRSNNGRRGDRGAWGDPPKRVEKTWETLQEGYDQIVEKYPKLSRNAHPTSHLGTLGGGNHFVEVCLDEDDRVWVMLHSGSRGVGNRIGSHFISVARKEIEKAGIRLVDKDLSYFKEGTESFDDYVFAVAWAQDYARLNRDVMMQHVIEALRRHPKLPQFRADLEAVNCHHNYVTPEVHYGEEVYVTRKGAVNAAEGMLGIIPGSMGAKSFIVRGKGNPESFHSCSHGAGRKLSRTKAKKLFTLEDHEKATEGVECRKDQGVIDETPGAYKDIDAVMAAQSDLVDILYTLKQIVCVKG